MFGKKKEPKVEQVFKPEDEASNQTDAEAEEKEASLDEILGAPEEQEPEKKLSPKEQEKLDNLNKVKSKISRILQSSNIEIIDENEGDDYNNSSDADLKRRQQEDYDSLKSLFGGTDKNKKQELTLTIDDFDYSYTGQYVDEYDLVHLKNIKKVKLQHKHKKLIKRLSIAAAIVLVLAVGLTVGLILIRKTPVYLKSISLSKTEQTYYLNDSFDFTGLYIYAEYSNGEVVKTPLLSSYCYDTQGYVETNTLTFTNGTDATLFFSYMGLSTSMKITIVEKEVSGLHVICSDGLYKLSAGEYITTDDLLVFVDYSNHVSELLDVTKFNVKVGTSSGASLLSYKSEHGGFELLNDVDSLNYIQIEYSYTHSGVSRTAYYVIQISE